MFKHYNPVALHFGWGVRQQVLPALQEPTLVVTGAQTLERADWLDLLGPHTHRSHAVPPNAGDNTIDDLLQQARHIKAKTILGVGGGSVMDATKIVASLLNNFSTVDAYRSSSHAPQRQVRLIQVPTTAGTGSEVTRWASVWNAGIKASIDEKAGFADTAFVDPELSSSAPPRLALACGLDAMSHAMESLWGIHHTPISVGYATQALSLIATNFIPILEGRGNRPHWEAMALASTLAGLALSCTRSAAAHALSYELTGHYGLEHGLAVGLLCKSLLYWNAPFATQSIEAITKALGVTDLQGAQAFIDKAFYAANLQPHLSFFGISTQEFSGVIAQASHSNRLGNNPTSFDEATLFNILNDIA